MRYRVVRLAGDDHYMVQWAFLGLLRGYAARFPTHAEAQEYINKWYSCRRDKGEKWPWQPTYYP